MELEFRKWINEQAMGQNSAGGDVSSSGLIRPQNYKPLKKRSKKAEKLFGYKKQAK